MPDCLILPRRQTTEANRPACSPPVCPAACLSTPTAPQFDICSEHNAAPAEMHAIIPQNFITLNAVLSASKFSPFPINKYAHATNAMVADSINTMAARLNMKSDICLYASSRPGGRILKHDENVSPCLMMFDDAIRLPRVNRPNRQSSIAPIVNLANRPNHRTLSGSTSTTSPGTARMASDSPSSSRRGLTVRASTCQR